jgi:hypothetical protein
VFLSLFTGSLLPVFCFSFFVLTFFLFPTPFLFCRWFFTALLLVLHYSLLPVLFIVNTVKNKRPN